MKSEERRKLFLDPLVQKLVEFIINDNHNELKPDYNPTKGFYYEKIDEITGNTKKTEEILQKLSDSMILEKKFYNNTVACPSCKSLRINMRYLCPNCKSSQIDRKTLLEHTKCGVIDSIDRFQKENKLVCHRCGKELTKEDPELKSIGSWFHCFSCDTRFDEPAIFQHCMGCDKEFSIREADFKSVFLYSLNKESRDVYERELGLLSTLKPELEKLGYKVDIGSSIIGKSGTKHEFDIVAYKDPKKITVIDVMVGSEAIGTPAISSLFAKIFDVKSYRQILVAIPKVDEESLRLAESYKIEVVETKTIKESIDKLVALLKGSLVKDRGVGLDK